LPERAVAEVIDYYEARSLSLVFYDLITAHGPSCRGDLEFYFDLIPPCGRVLELGCGTGRVCVALAERGMTVTGVDIAPGMLDRARRKLERLDPSLAAKVDLRQGDMTELELGRRFDAVIAPFFGFAHLPLGEPRRAAFRAIAAHLEPEGVAVLHLPLATALVEPPQRGDDDTVLRATFDRDGRRLAIRAMQARFDPDLGRFSQLLEYTVSDAAGATLRQSTERMTYFVGPLDEDAQAAGLVRDRPGGPFNDASEMHVFRQA
jgi:SAM-dependent methyltransferase